MMRNSTSSVRLAGAVLGTMGIVGIASADTVAQFSDNSDPIFSLTTTGNTGTISAFNSQSGFTLSVIDYNSPSAVPFGSTKLAFSPLSLTKKSTQGSTSIWDVTSPVAFTFKSGGNDVFGVTFNHAKVVERGNILLSLSASGDDLVGFHSLSSGYTLPGYLPKTGQISLSFARYKSTSNYGATFDASADKSGIVTPEPLTYALGLAGVGLFVRRRNRR